MTAQFVGFGALRGHRPRLQWRKNHLSDLLCKAITASRCVLTGVLMKAMQVNESDMGPVLILADLSKPEPGLGEVLVDVRAAGVTPTELLWYPTTRTKSGTARLR